MGVAKLTTTAVAVDTASETSLYRLDPPLAGDDGTSYEYGAVIHNPLGGLIDVFAARMDGTIVVDDDGEWVSLLNSSALDDVRPTVTTEFHRAGYMVH
ncbi:hypothetical protein [Rhodococcus sp. NPDC059234]|uniref:hypothetical protein n=1 Tax=Rhodococcus sp. NPDC059234 TaxID=3346781 RepID=UPI00366CEA20